MECKTKEAVEILHQQFNKFITPSVPQQEERIQEISDIAQRLYGKFCFKIPRDSALNKSVVNLILQKWSTANPQGPHYTSPFREKTQEPTSAKVNIRNRTRNF